MSAGSLADSVHKRAACEADPLLADSPPSWQDDLNLVRWYSDFGKQHGHSLAIFVVVHLFFFKGVVFSLALDKAALFIYKEYGISSSEIQVLSTAAYLPWAMKPVIGLISDLYPIGGYNKFPYAFSASLLGTAAFLSVGLLPANVLPLTLCVTLFFIANYDLVCVDVLQQGTYASRVQASRVPSMRSSFINFYWLLMTAGACAGLISSGFVIQYWSPRGAFLLSSVCALVITAMVWNNCYGEEKVDVDRSAKIHAFINEHWEICSVCAWMLAAVIVIFFTSILLDDVVVRSSIAIIMTLTVMCSMYILLPGIVGQASVYAILTSMMCYDISAADFYFCTDSPLQYPEGPHFTNLYYSSVQSTARACGEFLGIIAFVYLAKGWTYGKWLIMANAAFIFFNFPSVMLYRRWNLGYGIPDSHWVVFSSGLYGLAQPWRWMPLFALFNFLCPAGMEAAVFGILMGGWNLGAGAAHDMGVLVLEYLAVSPSGQRDESAAFDRLWLASLCAPTVGLIFSCLLLPLLPDEEMDAAGMSSQFRATWSSKASILESSQGVREAAV